MLDLVNQLLDMSKLMIAKDDQKLWRSGNVIAYIRMILESYKDYAASCQVSLNFNPEVNVLDMDFVPEYFEKILRNLLSNALKFTPQHGSITIKVKAEEKILDCEGQETHLCEWCGWHLLACQEPVEP